jgi:hypothetical protein
MKLTSMPSNWIMLVIISLILFPACTKEINQPRDQEEMFSAANKTTNNATQGLLTQTKTYSSVVVLKWMDLQ